MSREFLFTAGTGISVTPTNNDDGTVTWTVTNTSPGGGGTLTTTSVAGTGAWITNGGTLQGIAYNLSGDGTTGTPSAGNWPFTLATVNASVGTFGDSTHVAQFTVNAKGLITGVTSVAIAGISTPVSVPNGGTGQSSLTANSVLLGNGTSAVAFATTGTGGRVLTDTGGAPAFAFPGGDVTGAYSNLTVAPARTQSQFTSHIGGATVIVHAAVSTLDTITVTVAAGQVVLVWADLAIADTANDEINCDVVVDTGAFSAMTQIINALSAAGGNPGCHAPLIRRFTGLSAGSHTINLIANNGTGAGGATANWTMMTMVVTS